MQAQRNEENWRNIDGYVDYQVSNCGRIRRINDGRILRGYINTKGYRVVTIRKRHHQVHRLVAEAFIDNPNNKPCVDHIDGNRLNNDVTNLRWVTHAENCRNSNQRGGSSRFKGVHQREYGRWRAQITKDGRTMSLGTFDTEVEAAEAYNAAAREHFGEYARLNVIE